MQNGSTAFRFVRLAVLPFFAVKSTLLKVLAGLYKPQEIYKEKEVASFVEELTTSNEFKNTYNSSYTNDYTGKIEYTQYVKK